MSELDFRQVKNPDTGESLGTNYLINGTAKALTRWNASYVLLSSFNNSSFTDLGTGRIRINFINAFVGFDYCVSGAAANGTPAAFDVDVEAAWLATSCIVRTVNHQALADRAGCGVFHGTLA
ncbi:MAG: hypothetical protein COB90_09745 [Hyphomicrobiales bacterium]|nr:MAG: hypothetical protein COB90_09745 [Hyphomicrobiales bacterium]